MTKDFNEEYELFCMCRGPIITLAGLALAWGRLASVLALRGGAKGMRVPMLHDTYMMYNGHRHDKFYHSFRQIAENYAMAMQFYINEHAPRAMLSLN
jgi:hypothetical protein